jgi:hypothetical protein
MATKVKESTKGRKEPWLQAFAKRALLHSLLCYAICSWFEIALMTLRTSEQTQVVQALAEDLLWKMTVLPAASFLFGFSFIVFRLKSLPSAAKRFFHMVLTFIPVVMVAQSLVVSNNLDSQAYVGFYFFAFLIFLAVYGICMLIAHFIKKNS